MRNDDLDRKLIRLKSAGTNKATFVAFAFAMICLLVVAVCKLALQGQMGSEIYIALAAMVVYWFANNILGVPNRPLNFFGKPLPMGNSNADRKVRIKAYLFEALLFGALCAFGEAVFMGFSSRLGEFVQWAQDYIPNISEFTFVLLFAIASFVAVFAVMFALVYVSNEVIKLPRLNRIIAEQDMDEE